MGPGENMTGQIRTWAKRAWARTGQKWAWPKTGLRKNGKLALTQCGKAQFCTYKDVWGICSLCDEQSAIELNWIIYILCLIITTGSITILICFVSNDIHESGEKLSIDCRVPNRECAVKWDVRTNPVVTGY